MRILVFLGALLFSLPAFANQVVAFGRPCQADEFHQMDFWLGDWNVTWTGGHGTVHVTREFDGCLIHERFSEDPRQDAIASAGESWSVYDAPNVMWRQTGVGNRGEYYDLTGGPKPDGTFVLQIIRVGPRTGNAARRVRGHQNPTVSPGAGRARRTATPGPTNWSRTISA